MKYGYGLHNILLLIIEIIVHWSVGGIVIESVCGDSDELLVVRGVEYDVVCRLLCVGVVRKYFYFKKLEY
jgi:hypothetical protein